jgi:hypothetical protein
MKKKDVEKQLRRYKMKKFREADPDGLGAHDAGARKDDAGKLRYDLIPLEALEALARVYTFGADKYEDNNWKKGIRFSRVVAAMWRHMVAWAMGQRDDPETGINHLAHVAWGCFTLIYFQHHLQYDRFDDACKKSITPVDEQITPVANKKSRPRLTQKSRPKNDQASLPGLLQTANSEPAKVKKPRKPPTVTQ